MRPGRKCRGNKDFDGLIIDNLDFIELLFARFTFLFDAVRRVLGSSYWV